MGRYASGSKQGREILAVDLGAHVGQFSFGGSNPPLPTLRINGSKYGN